MDTRRIGSLEVSVVGPGCNNFGRRLDSDATSAVDAGINFFDTADVYGAKRRHACPANPGPLRVRVCLGWSGHRIESREQIQG
jgi:hypothetical protein